MPSERSNSENKSSLTIDVQSLKKQLAPVFQKFSISFAYLFGSTVTDKAAWWSDIDLAVGWPEFLEKSAKKQLRLLGRLALELEEVSSLHQIDLKIFEQLPIYVQFQVVKNGWLLFDSNNEYRLKQLEITLHKYYDYSIWWEKKVLPQVIKEFRK